jgi:hypothetical protein
MFSMNEKAVFQKIRLSDFRGSRGVSLVTVPQATGSRYQTSTSPATQAKTMPFSGPINRNTLAPISERTHGFRSTPIAIGRCAMLVSRPDSEIDEASNGKAPLLKKPGLSKTAGCERGVKRGFAKHRKPNGLMDTVIAVNGPGSFQKLEVQKILVSNS